MTPSCKDTETKYQEKLPVKGSEPHVLETQVY